jgi:transcriptional regulator with XRE-family HTH domain
MAASCSWPALGAALCAARRRSALSQADIARHLGISQPAYSQIERGLTRPRPALLVPLVQLLGLRLGDVTALASYPIGQVIRSVMTDVREEHTTPAHGSAG